MIIDRYIVHEVLKPLVIISAILIVIFVGYSSGRYLSYAVDGLLQVDTLVSFILIKVVIALEVLLPIAWYLSIVMGLGRLESMSEITAMRALGIGRDRIMRVVVAVSVVLACVVGLFSIYGRPLAYEHSYWIKAKAESELELDKLESSNFYDSGDRARTIFVEEVDKQTGRLNRIFIRSGRGETIQLIYAQAGKHMVDDVTGRRVLLLSDVHVYVLGLRGSTDKGIGIFKEMRLIMDDADPVSVGYKRKAEATVTLAKSHMPLDVAEFQWRLSTPVSTILLAVIAVVLSRAAPRSSRYTKIVAALFIYVIYYNLSAMAKTWVETGVVGRVPGIWWVQMLSVCLIVSMIIVPEVRFRRAAARSRRGAPGALAVK